MEEGKTPGKLVVISGPSGCGKTTILERLLTLNRGRLELSVSATTRPPRAGEIDGKSYRFLSAAEFDRLREEGEFIECVEVYPGLWYGTLRSAVTPGLAAGKSVILEIDVRGMKSVVEQTVDAITIFIHPPSLLALEQRLRGRHTETELLLKRRLEVARREIESADGYQHQIVNRNVDEAAEAIREIINLAESRSEVETS